MADDTAPIPFPDKQIDPPESEAVPAKERLAAAQEKLNLEPGHERGIGSRYAALHPSHKAHLAAIEHLIAVEAEHADAERALHVVHAKLEHAMARVDATEETSNAELGAQHG